MVRAIVLACCAPHIWFDTLVVGSNPSSSTFICSLKPSIMTKFTDPGEKEGTSEEVATPPVTEGGTESETPATGAEVEGGE